MVLIGALVCVVGVEQNGREVESINRIKVECTFVRLKFDLVLSSIRIE
jgi:hypothetical protein